VQKGFIDDSTGLVYLGFFKNNVSKENKIALLRASFVSVIERNGFKNLFRKYYTYISLTEIKSIDASDRQLRVCWSKVADPAKGKDQSPSCFRK